MTVIDYEAYYTIKGEEGIAYFLRGPVMVRDEDYEWSGIEYEHPDGFIRAVMVGDDREHAIDPTDLVLLGEDDFCHGCGQVGCTAER